jgi:glycosyltransferase involved in cell wall biosynthesis
MRPLKIALLSQWYWQESRFHGEDEGGPTRQLAEAVAALGHEVVVLTQNPTVRKLRKLPIGALETWVSPRGRHRGPFSGLRDKLARKSYSHPQVYSDARVLRDFLKLRGPFDVVWANAESPDGLVAAIAAKMGVKLPPVLLQIQALRCRFEKGAPIFTDKLPLSLAFRQATRILANSEMIVGFLDQYAGRGLTAEAIQAKVHIVPPNLQRIFFQAAAQKATPPSAPMKDRILFLGALNQRKGAPVFLRAIPKTEASKRNATFVIIGDYTEDNKRFVQRWEEAREATRAQLPSARMEYLGRVSSTEVIRQVRLAQVVVIPSLFDAFSRGVAEALLLGRPVVTTEREGAAPLVKQHQAGVVVAPNDSSTLARAIDVILSPIVPFARYARQIGAGQFHEFSTETVAAQIARHLSEVAL